MLVSIIIPVYNSERYLNVCIDSILNQDFNDYEIILINDGSIDNSKNICNTYSKKFSNIKIFHINNSGPSHARNIGIAAACGKYIQFLDSDDILPPDSLKTFAYYSEKYSCDLHIGASIICNDCNTKVGEIIVNTKGCFSINEILSELNNNNKPYFMHYVWNKWYLRGIINNNNIKFDENCMLGEDFLFNCDYYSSISNINIINHIIHKYYIRKNDSLTHKFVPYELNRREKMDKKLINLFTQFNLIDTHKSKLDNIIGKVAFESFISVYNTNCKYNYKERKKYLQQFLECKYFEYILQYLRLNSMTSAKYYYIYLLVKYKIYSLIDLSFLFSKYLKFKK